MNRIAIAVLLLSSLSGCVDVAKRSTVGQAHGLTAAEQARDIILALPHWLATGGGGADSVSFGKAESGRYEAAAIRLQRYSPSDIRAGIKLAINTAGGARREDVYADVFVILRVLYDVPVELARPLLLVGSPYAVFAQPSGSRTYRLRWPVSIDSNGSVSAITDFMGAMGGGYEPLDEYDWLRAKFTYRQLPSGLNRSGLNRSGQ